MKLATPAPRSRAIILACLLMAVAGCATSPEAKSARYIERGKQLLLKKDASRALLEFRNAVRTTPKNAEAHYQLALAYLAINDPRNCVFSLRKALEFNPKHGPAQLRLAQLMSTVDDPEILRDAQRRLEQYIQENPVDPYALHALALTELKLGDQESGIQNLQRAVTMAPQTVSLAATLAQAKLDQKDAKGAEEVLKKSCEDTRSPAAYVILGRLYASENRADEAEQQYRKALSGQPKYGPALFNLAILQNNTGRKQEAEATFHFMAAMSEPEFNYMYGVYLFEQGRRDEAIRELDRLAKASPDDRQARTRLVAAYEGSGRVPDARNVLNTVLKKNPNDLDALLQRAELCLRTHEYPQAQADLNNVVARQPDSAEVHYALARLHDANGAGALQRQELTEALKWNPTILPIRIELAKALVRDRAPQAALDLLEQAPASQKATLAVQEARNWALMGLNKYVESRQAVDQALRLNRTPVLLVQDAVLKLSAKDYAAARASAEEAIHKNAGEMRAIEVVVQSYIAQNHFPEAVQKLQEYAANAHSAEVYQYLGQLLARSGQPEQARAAFNSAKAMDVNFTAADLAIAQIDANAGKQDEARKRAESVLVNHAGDLSARLFLAQLDLRGRSFQRAVDQYRKIVQEYPRNVHILNNLAYSLAETGSYDEALKYGQLAKELAPDNADVDDTLGWVMYRKGVYPSAIQYLKSAVAKDRTALNHYHLAMAYLKSGNQQLGKESLHAARALDPNLPEAKAADQILAEAVPAQK